ncbi:hypothetical protein RDABS01_035647 [Bienertia sinuspersici]
MIIRSPEPEVKILVDRDPVKTSFEEWARPGHFSKTIAKGPETTTWIWNLHADANDFDSLTSDLEEISRKIFSAHFGQLSIIFLWLSGMYFHSAHFSTNEAWLSDPTHIGPSAQVVWPIVGQEILNGDVVTPPNLPLRKYHQNTYISTIEIDLGMLPPRDNVRLIILYSKLN